MILWHWLVHVTGCDYGAPYGHFVWYDLYSGFAASYPYLLIPALLLWYWHHSCHRQSCLRPARYDFTDMATGLTWRLCGHCHPAHPGHPLTRRHIARIHEANRGGSAPPP